MARGQRSGPAIAAHGLGKPHSLQPVLLVLDGLGWRVVAAAFDRERLITGTR